MARKLELGELYSSPFFMEKVVEISWKIYGFFMLVCSFFMEKLWRKCGDFVCDP